MATRNSTTVLAHPAARRAIAHTHTHAHLLQAYVQVALTASERCQGAARCPDVLHLLELAHGHLLDARASDRFHGRNETIDPKAGHISGAINAPFQDNLGPDGYFLPAATLRRRFVSLFDGTVKPVACYCGSGVSATHNVLAMVHAGLPEPALYAGSWSEWITRPDNPSET